MLRAMHLLEVNENWSVSFLNYGLIISEAEDLYQYTFVI